MGEILKTGFLCGENGGKCGVVEHKQKKSGKDTYHIFPAITLDSG